MNVKHKNDHLGTHNLSVWGGGWRKNQISPFHRQSLCSLLRQEAGLAQLQTAWSVPLSHCLGSPAPH